MTDDMKEKIERLCCYATYDFRDYWEKKERLMDKGAIYGDKPGNFSGDPLLAERYLLEKWRFVFAILLDTDHRSVAFVYNNDLGRYETRVNDKCIYFIQGGNHGDNT